MTKSVNEMLKVFNENPVEAKKVFWKKNKNWYLHDTNEFWNRAMSAYPDDNLKATANQLIDYLYTIMATMVLSYMGVLTATYYVSRGDKPELALLCYRTQGKALGMSGELADHRFITDVQKFGVEMIKVFDKEIQSCRRI